MPLSDYWNTYICIKAGNVAKIEELPEVPRDS